MDLAIVKSFTDANVAKIACAKLQSEGIAATINDEDYNSMEYVTGGVKLVVRDCDLARAKDTLARVEPYVDGHQIDRSRDERPRCPNCSSEEFYPSREVRLPFGLRIPVIPIPLLPTRMECSVCHHSWIVGSQRAVH